MNTETHVGIEALAKRVLAPSWGTPTDAERNLARGVLALLSSEVTRVVLQEQEEKP